jgi:holin-like protein
VLGLLLLLGLLGTGLCSTVSVRRGSRWFLAQMLLFLLPAVMSLADHREFFGWLGCKVLAAVCLGTLIVMVVTALLVDGCYRWLLAQRMPARAGRGEAGRRP